MHAHRRASDQQSVHVSWQKILAGRDGLYTISWAEQRTQYLTRYLFWALGLAYFNLGEPTARSADWWLAANLMLLALLTLTTIYLIHSLRIRLSPLRLRLSMWTDLLGASFVVLADSNVMSPAYLVYLVIILGNGMRYGMRMFAEAALGSFVVGMIVLSLRVGDYMNAMSVASVFFIMFCAIIVLYAYSLMSNVDRARRQLEIKSCLDVLTGLLNRRGLYEKSAHLFSDLDKQQQPLAVLFADLDGFKAINDAMGHDTGDTVLKEIAGLIGFNIRASDVAARFGGDEFVILLPETNMDKAMSVAQRVQNAVNSWAQSGNMALSVSIGMGEAPGHGRDLNSVLKCVDSALYQCKLSFGKGGIQRADLYAT